MSVHDMNFGLAHMKSFSLYLYLFLHSVSCAAQDKVITFSYWSEVGLPFIFLGNKNSNDIDSGLVKDLAELIADRLQAIPRLVNILVQRTNSQLLSGAIDLNCITNPIWKQTPDDFYWSPALFKGVDRFLVKPANKHELVVFDDLKGKVLAVYNGYTYHPKIMEMIAKGDIDTVKVSGIDQGIKLLLLDRINALIDFDIRLQNKE
tara:strand:- start:1471 stop:2085 length:615 start_codon:yes stop_codon:yes gene_type:complete